MSYAQYLKFYLHSPQVLSGGPSGPATPLASVASSWTSDANAANFGVSPQTYQMTPFIGTSQVSIGAAVAPGSTVGARRFFSPPLEAQTISGTFVFSGAASTGNASAAPGQEVWLAIWNPTGGSGAGAVRSILYATQSNVWQGSNGSAQQAGTSAAIAMTSQVAQAGDSLVMEVYVTGSTSQTTTLTMYYDGTTEGSTSSNASYISFSSPILLRGTKLYLHDAVASLGTGTLPGSATVSASTPTVTGLGATTNRSMDLVIGGGQASLEVSTSATKATQTDWIAKFVSRPLASQTIAAQVIRVSYAGSESNTNSNYNGGACLAVWRPSTGALVGRIFDVTTAHSSQDPSQPGNTSENSSFMTFAASQTSAVTAAAGDVLVLEVWNNQAQSMATSYTNTFFYDGSAEMSDPLTVASNAGSNLLFANDVAFLPPGPLRDEDAFTAPYALNQSVHRASSY